MQVCKAVLRAVWGTSWLQHSHFLARIDLPRPNLARAAAGVALGVINGAGGGCEEWGMRGRA